MSAETLEHPPIAAEQEWYLGPTGTTIFQNHGSDRRRVCTVHGATELIPHAEQERNARLIVNAGRLATAVRRLIAFSPGSSVFESDEGDAVRAVLAAIEGTKP